MHHRDCTRLILFLPLITAVLEEGGNFNDRGFESVFKGGHLDLLQVSFASTKVEQKCLDSPTPFSRGNPSF